MAEKKACVVPYGEIGVGGKTIQECAVLSSEKSSGMFTVSRQDSGYCIGNKCKCYYYPNFFQDGACPQQFRINNDLYRIKTQSSSIKGDFLKPRKSTMIIFSKSC